MTFIPSSDFCASMIKVNEAGDRFELFAHQVVIFDKADELRSEWNQFVYSAIKKSGKTTINAIQAIKWALEHPDDELIIQANDYDQSVARVFTSAVKLCGATTSSARYSPTRSSSRTAQTSEPFRATTRARQEPIRDT